MRAPARMTRGALLLELIHTITRSGISPGSSPSRCRYDAAFSPTSSATARSASSRSVDRFPSRKKLTLRELALRAVADEERQLAQRRQASLAKEVGHGLPDPVRPVCLSLAPSSPK